MTMRRLLRFRRLAAGVAMVAVQGVMGVMGVMVATGAPAAAATPDGAGAGWSQDARVAARLDAQVRDLLAREAAALPGQLAFQVAAPQLDKRAACDAFEVYKPGGFRLRPSMALGLRCLAPQRWSALLQVQATVTGRYPVAAHGLAPGGAVGAQDYVMREGDLLRLPADTVFDAALLAGRTTRQRIGAGQPLRAGSLRSADAVLRGALVKLVFKGEGFSASSEGVALEEVPPGGTVPVRVASGHVVSGVVRGAGLVEVVAR